jgi:pimeloyl-ACP methyl ester carboxylesterase
MSKLKIAPDLEMHYRIDNFCDPWSEVETILLLHGIAESSLAWYRWIPVLASRFRVVRPDLRGFGKSTAMPADYPWSIDVIAKDVIALADKLEIDRFHLVGAKLGGTVAVRLAATATKRVSSLSIIGSPVTAAGMLVESIPAWLRTIETTGIESWALSSMDARLGRSSPDAAKRWWAAMMAQTATTSLVGLLRALPQIDVTDDLDRICCRTMIATGSGGGLGTTQEIRAWQESISNSRLVVLPTDAYHIAAAAARQVAERVVEFVESGPREA